MLLTLSQSKWIISTTPSCAAAVILSFSSKEGVAPSRAIQQLLSRAQIRKDSFVFAHVDKQRPRNWEKFSSYLKPTALPTETNRHHTSLSFWSRLFSQCTYVHLSILDQYAFSAVPSVPHSYMLWSCEYDFFVFLGFVNRNRIGNWNL
jgi:hypothetical protein